MGSLRAENHVFADRLSADDRRIHAPMSTPPEAERARFQAERPPEIRHAPRWHRLAYIVRTLPAALGQLAPELRVAEGDRVLDYGCADVPYRGFFGAGVNYVTADLPGNPAASVEIADDGSVPCEDESFDAVVSTQVLEHVQDPGLYLSECHRVLRPGGRILLSTHGMMLYHPDPVDYWRWTCAGLRRIVEDAGFEIVRFEGIMGLTATGLQFTQDSLLGRLPRFMRPALCLVMQWLIALADRFESRESRELNALVFALVATRR
jgi:SAM-dependent methyltransferase